MRILHCCLANFYIDNYGYQENVLPRAHSIMGHEVLIVASTETYVEGSKRAYTKASAYISNDGIKVVRLAYIKWLPAVIARKLRIYTGLKEQLDTFKPEIVFLHDMQFLSIIQIRRYAKRTGAIILVDSHTDFVNSARNLISRHILHGIIYKFCARLIEPVTTRFYPTLPARAVFMEKMYGISQDKMKILPFGVDDTKNLQLIDENSRKEIRRKFGFSCEDIVLIAGGKIDARKRILELLKIFPKIRKSSSSPVKLLIFGVPDKNCTLEFNSLIKQDGVTHIGWLAPEKIAEALQCSDIAIFPGTHSVLWEEAIGLGVPCIFRKIEGFEHIDLGGNCRLIASESSCELVNVILETLKEKNTLQEMKERAMSLGRKKFSYMAIAQEAIQDLPMQPNK